MKRRLPPGPRALVLWLVGPVILLLLSVGVPWAAARAEEDVPATPTIDFVSPLITPTPAGGPPPAAIPRPTATATVGPTPTASPTPTSTPTPTATPTATYAPFQVSPLVTLTDTTAVRGDLTQLWLGAAALLLVLGSALMVWGERNR